MTVVTVSLPDGSVATVESTGPRSSLISRSVDGQTVWGQAFSIGGKDDEHERQVRDVLDEMTARPQDFFRWWTS